MIECGFVHKHATLAYQLISLMLFAIASPCIMEAEHGVTMDDMYDGEVPEWM